jgi:hypothetical protein
MMNDMNDVEIEALLDANLEDFTAEVALKVLVGLAPEGHNGVSSVVNVAFDYANEFVKEANRRGLRDRSRKLIQDRLAEPRFEVLDFRGLKGDSN